MGVKGLSSHNRKDSEKFSERNYCFFHVSLIQAENSAHRKLQEAVPFSVAYQRRNRLKYSPITTKLTNQSTKRKYNFEIIHEF